MTSFQWQVNVDGSDISPLVLEGATITVGRQTVLEQPAIPVAVLELLTRDAWAGATDRFPEFGLGDWATDLSGFVDEYSDTYAGVTSRLTIGVPVTIGIGSESGFTDTYAATYEGADYRRFTGIAQAITYTPGLIQLTCTPKSEQWSRVQVGGTDASTTIPAELDAARCQRLASEAGFSLQVDGEPSCMVTPIRPNTRPSSLLAQLQQIATDTGGMVYTDTAGWVHVETREYQLAQGDGPVTVLPPGITLVDALKMELELGLVRNRVTLEYGSAPDGTANRPTVQVLDQAQVDRYGLRDYQASTVLNDQADASWRAQQLLDALSPAWVMPDAELAMGLADGPTIAAVCELQLGSVVQLPELLTGSPDPSYTGQLLGYTEKLSRNDWRISLHLSPQQEPQP